MLERVGIEESGRLEEAVLDAGRARALVDVASAVLSTLEVGEVVTRVAWGARTLLRSRRAAILAYDPGTATLSGVTGLGIRPDHVRGLRLRLAESATVELAVLDGRARHSEQAYGEPTIKLALGLDSFVCIPLKTNDELRGVVLVDVAADAFGPDERRLADEFGHLASIGLENARKHRRARLPTALAGASRASQELHDTVLQALFAIGVEADGLVTHSPEDEPARDRRPRERSRP